LQINGIIVCIKQWDIQDHWADNDPIEMFVRKSGAAYLHGGVCIFLKTMR